MLDGRKGEIRERVTALQKCQAYSLRTLFGGRKEFERYGSPGQRKAVGTEFRKAVDYGYLKAINYSKCESSS